MNTINYLQPIDVCRTLQTTNTEYTLSLSVLGIFIEVYARP